MLDYLKAELYRYTHKRSTYVHYAVIILVLIIGFIFAAYNGVQSDTMIDTGAGLTYFLPLFIGIPIFLTIYNDDLNAKSMGNVISTKASRTSLLVAKFIASAIVMLAGYLIMAAVFFISYFLMFKTFNNISAEQLNIIINAGIIRFIATLGFFSIANIITFAFQKSSFSLIFIVTLILGFIAQLLNILTLISSSLVVLVDNSLTAFTNKATDIIANGGSIPSSFYIASLAYIVISFIITVLIFRNRDIEVN